MMQRWYGMQPGLIIVAGDELHCLPGGSGIYGKWASHTHDGDGTLTKELANKAISPGKRHTDCPTYPPSLIANRIRLKNELMRAGYELIRRWMR